MYAKDSFSPYPAQYTDLEGICISDAISIMFQQMTKLTIQHSSLKQDC